MIEADDRQNASLRDLQYQNAHADKEETREELHLLGHQRWPPSRTRRALWHIDRRCGEVSSRKIVMPPIAQEQVVPHRKIGLRMSLGIRNGHRG
jgi:hypothetical protein